MRSHHRRTALYGACTAALALAGAVALTPSASASVDPAPIGPHNYFIGQVNGASANAVIRVVCPGPATPGQTGHPVSGQTVDALPVASPGAWTVGYTGEAADRVIVSFDAPASSGTPVTLTSWAVAAPIPTALNLPCSGTGTVTYTPAPTSSTARPATVTVTYQNIAL